MANDAKPVPGQIGCIDLTVPGAEAARDFYRDVTGWTPSPVARGDRQDCCMNASSGQGVNAGLPRVWMTYIVVAGPDEAKLRCQARGGKVLRAPEDADAGNRFRVIQDPAGAVAALVASQSGSV